jgi:hypothetical protein
VFVDTDVFKIGEKLGFGIFEIALFGANSMGNDGVDTLSAWALAAPRPKAAVDLPFQLPISTITPSRSLNCPNRNRHSTSARVSMPGSSQMSSRVCKAGSRVWRISLDRHHLKRWIDFIRIGSYGDGHAR